MVSIHAEVACTCSKPTFLPTQRERFKVSTPPQLDVRLVVTTSWWRGFRVVRLRRHLQAEEGAAGPAQECTPEILQPSEIEHGRCEDDGLRCPDPTCALKHAGKRVLLLLYWHSHSTHLLSCYRTGIDSSLLAPRMHNTRILHLSVARTHDIAVRGRSRSQATTVH